MMRDTSTPKFQLPTPKKLNYWELDLFWELGIDGSQSTVHSVSEFTSLMKMRLPESVGCAHVSLSATV
jgi:hypothetical protein